LPVVLKVHGSDILELPKHPGRRRGTIAALCGADRVVAVSRDLAQKAIDLGADPSRVHLIYNGLDDTVFHPGRRQEARERLALDTTKPVVLYVGNLVPVKGPDVLIEACGLIAAWGVDFDLHVIGRGALRGSLERLASERRIGGRVTFHGPVAHEKLPDWFRAASLLVLPSRSEGVPNVLLEASACGTPYVASQVGGVPEIAHLGLSRLVPKEDPLALARAIQETLAQPPQQRERPPSIRSHCDSARELTCVFEALINNEGEKDPDTLFRSAEFPQIPTRP
jgi:glycosyltransferase involved in cell wall biosynthesis